MKRSFLLIALFVLLIQVLSFPGSTEATQVYADMVRETSISIGTGTMSLDGAVTGYQTFVARIGDGNTCFYQIRNATAYEIGLGTVTDGSPDLLSRDTVYSSSNSDLLVDWPIGNKIISHVLPANKITDFLTSESDPTALLTADVGNIKDTHIDFGFGAAQVGADDIPIEDLGSIIVGTEVETALQENRTAIDLNTAKVTNATHTGDVTGSDVLTIGSDKIQDDEIDYVAVTLNDFTFDVGGVTKAEFAFGSTVTSNIQVQLDGKQPSDADLDTYAGITPTADGQALLASSDANSYTDAEQTKLAGIETLADVTDAANVEDAITGAAAATDPTDVGVFPVIITEVLQNITWLNIKATLKAYFDPLYEPAGITESDILDLDHTDVNAVHVSTASEISAITEKLSPVNADMVLIEDSEDLNSKKMVQVGNLPTGTTTETDPIVGAVSGIVKGDGLGGITAATAGTDYLTPTGDGSGLTGISASYTLINVTDTQALTAEQLTGSRIEYTGTTTATFTFGTAQTAYELSEPATIFIFNSTYGAYFDTQLADLIRLNGVALDDGDKVSALSPGIGDCFVLTPVKVGNDYQWNFNPVLGAYEDGGP